LLNTRYVLAHAEAPPPVGLQLIEAAEGVSLYLNPSALPRAYLAPKATVVRSEAEAKSKISEAGFDPAKTVVLEDAAGSLLAPSGSVIDQAGDLTGPIGGQSAPAVTLTQDRRNMVQISTDSVTGGVLFLSDTYYPGWHADIDGWPARIFKAD